MIIIPCIIALVVLATVTGVLCFRKRRQRLRDQEPVIPTKITYTEPYNPLTDVESAASRANEEQSDSHAVPYTAI